MKSTLRSAHDPFETCWDAHLKQFVAAEFPDGLSRPQRKMAERLYTDRFRQRRGIQLGIYQHLRDVLRGASHATDLMAGSGTATIPLVMSGAVERLTLVDDGDSRMTWQVAHGLVEELRLQDKVSLVTASLERNTYSIPEGDVLLIETGLALPTANRIHRDDLGNQDAQSFRSCHTLAERVTFEQLLANESLAIRGRILHVIDTPHYRRALTIGDTRNHLEACLGRSSIQWSLKEVRPIANQGTFYSQMECA